MAKINLENSENGKPNPSKHVCAKDEKTSVKKDKV